MCKASFQILPQPFHSFQICQILQSFYQFPNKFQVEDHERLICNYRHFYHLVHHEFHVNGYKILIAFVNSLYFKIGKLHALFIKTLISFSRILKFVPNKKVIIC